MCRHYAKNAKQKLRLHFFRARGGGGVGVRDSTERPKLVYHKNYQRSKNAMLHTKLECSVFFHVNLFLY